MEKFAYIFLDIEWNQLIDQEENSVREPVQIGIIGTNEKLEEKKRFSRFIRIKDVKALSPDTRKTAHVTPALLKEVKSETVVYHRVSYLFPQYQYVVVWTEDAYDIFAEGMNRSNIRMPEHKVVVLQDIVSLIAAEKEKRISFEAALMKAGVSFQPKRLHYAKYDAQYLCQLYKKLYEKYADRTREQKCILNQNTGILHTAGCKYIKKNHTNFTEAEKILIFHGYRPCLYCRGKGGWKVFRWKTSARRKTAEQQKKSRMPENKMDFRTLSLTEKNIYLICRQFHLNCHISDGVVFIRAPFSAWRIYLDHQKVSKVYHENYRGKRTGAGRQNKWSEGFHKQTMNSRNFYDVVRYIYYHEKNFMEKTNRAKQIDELLDGIRKDT